MSRCLIVREVDVWIRRPRQDAKTFRMVIPVHWTKSTLLSHVRAEHPGETVKIRSWYMTGSPTIWLPNPEGFADYRRGRLA